MFLRLFEYSDCTHFIHISYKICTDANGLMILLFVEPFGIRMKMFLPVNLANFKKINNMIEKREITHETDGFIFAKDREPYVGGTCQSLLKWKPPDKNSFDFKVLVERYWCLYILPVENKKERVNKKERERYVRVWLWYGIYLSQSIYLYNAGIPKVCKHIYTLWATITKRLSSKVLDRLFLR